MRSEKSFATTHYSPLYFLAALGTGGAVVTFFMWFLFWVPHPEHPVPFYEDIISAFLAGDGTMKAAISVAWAGVAVFAISMIRLLIWNLAEYSRFTQSEAYEALKSNNSETQLLALPLTFAMAINVAFIVALVFIPGLKTVIEYLFPFALLGFTAIGLWALKLLGQFWARISTDGGFDCAKNNSFSQLLPAFALAMIGVGMAAPSALSEAPPVVALSYIASSLFISMAVLLGVVQLILGVRSMMENGADDASAPTLWIVVPIITVISIAFMRQAHGLHTLASNHGDRAETFQMLVMSLSVQLAFLAFGWVVLRRQRYFERFVMGDEVSPGSYALVCPAIAMVVISQFFINKGLVGIGLLSKFSPTYWALTAAVLLLQLVALWLISTLNAKHFSERAEPKAVLVP